MKVIYLFLFSFLLIGLGHGFAQVSQEPQSPTKTDDGKGISVTFAPPSTDGNKTTNFTRRRVSNIPNPLTSIARTDILYQLLDNEKNLIRGRERIDYNSVTGAVHVDLSDLPPLPTGQVYKLRVRLPDRRIRIVDLQSSSVSSSEE